MKELFDVTIIGGGPAGLYAAFYSGLRKMKTKIIEYQPQLGGKVLLYPEKMIWDVGGQPPILGDSFTKQLVQQALTFHPAVCLNTKVDVIDKNKNGHFVIRTDTGEEHYSKAVIMANGGGIVNPQKLKVEGAEKFEMTNLHYTVPSLRSFKDKVVLISGGGNTAIDWAVELLPIARKILLVYRKDVLSAHEAQVDQLRNSNASLLSNTTITKLIANPEKRKIEKVQLLNSKTEEVTLQEVDHVIVNHGYNQDASLGFAPSLHIEKKDGYFYQGTATGLTTEKGIFAAGDILSYDGKINLLAGAFQDAVNAVNAAKTYTEPAAESIAMVSSHNDIFEARNRELMKELVYEN
ncbi:NAD(P)/FAD-dependent oxidoreductase [Caldibacillus lycopersici]|uniref:Ferredoxin--NADP reductase n=1 Tax=Perspicuibacillus lycopersici TaxID=1325689 RepID=A0AAE3LU22_9BACI|nr:NAD(P)/FAD-dependent oxidoreductase [Perspicuibacillus lycopersici]MCU9615013.1 NAD(P)/FAD-dependent oxidoreductase [Perspicuibacillus lycopersici]